MSPESMEPFMERFSRFLSEADPVQRVPYE